MEKLLDCLAFGRDERTYSEDIRTFCLTLHYYSPRAYNYVRSKFNNHLPSITAIRNWYASVNASPGFENDALDILKKKANEFKDKFNRNLLCSLVADEMAIRTHAQWNANKMKFDGFVDMGDKLTNQGILHLAKEALVFLVCGVEENFKIPIAYFLINSLDTQQKAFIINQLFTMLSEIKVEITSLTLDGLKTNISMCKFLGADFDGEAYIRDPLNKDRKIYVFLDPAHMMKLCRNRVAKQNLIDGKGRLIKWHYFELLYEAQTNLAWNLGNKLTKAHMQWDKRKMNVQLACETISYSVADSMEFLKQECDSFSEVDGTVEFIRTIKDVFNIMNSTKVNSIGFKRPISKENYVEYFTRFEQAIEYIKQLRVEGEKNPILKSVASTPFVGFYNNMRNFMGLFDDYVLKGQIDKLITHRFSQDHIETLFGCIRSMNGYNDNPTAQQFEAAYRKLLIHNEIVCPKKSNCIETGTKILTTSSHRPTKNSDVLNIQMQEIDDPFLFDGHFEKSFHTAHQFTEDAHSHSIAFSASVLEDKIIKAKKPKLLVKCQECIDTFVENELMNDSFIRFKTKTINIMQPCKSTFAICKFVDTFLKYFQDNTNNNTISYNMTLLQILQKIPFETLYTSSNFESHASKNQKYEFIKRIIEIYLNMKSVNAAKTLTLKVHGEPIRHDLKKKIHFASQ